MLHDHCASWQVIGAAIGIACAAATATLVVMLRPLLQRYALARPNARSSHRTPTPQGGGIAIMIATVGAVALVLSLYPALAPASSIAIVLAAALALAVVGAVDDIRVLRAAPRLVCQFAAASAVIAALPEGWHIIGEIPATVERVIVVLALVWFVNLVNFMDGIDWITVAEVVPVAGGLAAIAALGHAPPIVFFTAVAIAGAMVGFAPFNRPVARLFLGDVGSLPIGLLLGWLLVLVAADGHVVAALLLPLYYLADATVTLARRVVRGERVWEAHRTHYYQRATDRGFAVIEIVRRVFAVNLALVALAVASVVRPAWAVQLGCLGFGLVIVGLLLRQLGMGRG
jgi:UDP-N-acetylmuramyl pentapeptide phosphotransferase/UDP-N-acetylglucosamine-1-phosphate transferase